MSRVGWKFLVPNYELVKIISQKISTCMPTMAVKNGEEGTLGPSVAFLFCRLLNVQNYTHSVFIVITDYSLVCVCSISFNNSILLNRMFGAFKVWQLDMRNLHGQSGLTFRTINSRILITT